MSDRVGSDQSDPRAGQPRLTSINALTDPTGGKGDSSGKDDSSHLHLKRRQGRQDGVGGLELESFDPAEMPALKSPGQPVQHTGGEGALEAGGTTCSSLHFLQRIGS